MNFNKKIHGSDLGSLILEIICADSKNKRSDKKKK